LTASLALTDLAGVDVLLLFSLFVFNGLVAGVAVYCSGTTSIQLFDFGKQ
jgi:hypothetical protein